MFDQDSQSKEDPMLAALRDDDKITVRKPNATVEGARDVMTMRVLAKVIHALMSGKNSQVATGRDFAEAFAKVVNANGAIAKAMIDAER